jgi:hypothetical protein
MRRIFGIKKIQNRTGQKYTMKKGIILILHIILFVRRNSWEKM